MEQSLSRLERAIDDLQLSPAANELTPLLLVNPTRRASHQVSLDSELAASKSYIARLYNIRTKLDKAIATFHAHSNAVYYAQAPVSALPPEIVRTILVHAIIASPPSVIVRDTCRLSYVCSSWRHVALNHASFWSKVDLNALVVPELRIETWLSRTANVPLHLHALPLIPKASLRGQPVPCEYYRYGSAVNVITSHNYNIELFKWTLKVPSFLVWDLSTHFVLYAFGKLEL